MHKFLNLLAVAMLVMFTALTPAHAGSPRDLTVKSIFEFPLVSPTPTPAAGDYNIRWQGAQRRFIRVDPTLSGIDRTGTVTIPSGQTSAVATISGVTAGSRCQATQNNLATNPVYVRAAVAGAGNVTVTISGDPGVSGQTVALLCTN